MKELHIIDGYKTAHPSKQNPTPPPSQKWSFRDYSIIVISTLAVVLCIAIITGAWLGGYLGEAFQKIARNWQGCLLLFVGSVVMSCILFLIGLLLRLLITKRQEELRVRVTTDELKNALRDEAGSWIRFDNVQSPLLPIINAAEVFGRLTQPILDISHAALEKAIQEHIESSTICMRPEDYAIFVTEADQEYGPRDAHVDKIRLMGSMVGFAAVLPQALRDHTCVCATSNVFCNLELLVPYYPIYLEYTLYLVAQYAYSVLFHCKNVKERLDADRKITVTIVYCEHDLVTAAIDMVGSRFATLQALDVSLAQKTVSGIVPQEGFKAWRKDDAEKYERYSSALGSAFDYWRGIENLEIWELSKVKNKLQLSVTNRHWSSLPRRPWNVSIPDPAAWRKSIEELKKHPEKSQNEPFVVQEDYDIRNFLEHFMEILRIKRQSIRFTIIPTIDRSDLWRNCICGCNTIDGYRQFLNRELRPAKSEASE
jgi:hypothetical protein